MSQKMDPDIKAEWVKALRSGEYEQGAGWLKKIKDDSDVPQYCCLGVLCDLMADDLDLEIEIQDRGDLPTPYRGWAYDGAPDFPPDIVTNATGVSEFMAKELALMNDDKAWTFTKIADWIEENL